MKFLRKCLVIVLYSYEKSLKFVSQLRVTAVKGNKLFSSYFSVAKSQKFIF